MDPFFLSPGFGGLCAVIGAAIAYAAATLATRQKAKTEARQRAWDRFVWVMDHRREFNPELIADLLTQMITTAKRLEDEDLLAMGRQIGTELIQDGEQPSALGSSTTPADPADTEQNDQEGT